MGFPTVSPAQPLVRFALIHFGNQLWLSPIMVLLAPAAATSSAPLLVTATRFSLLGSAAASLGFLAASILAEPYYLPMRSVLNRTAAISAMLSSAALSLGLLGPLPVQDDVALAALSWLLAAIITAVALEHGRTRGLETLREHDACMACGHVVREGHLERCPECGGGLLRAEG